MGNAATGLYLPTYRDKKTGETKTQKVWWCQWYCRGLCGTAGCDGTHRESCGTDSLRDAKRFRADRVAAVNQGKPVRADVTKTEFADLVALIRNDYTVKQRRSLRRLNAAIVHLTDTFGMFKAAAITSEAITGYTIERSKKAAPATVKLELSALKKMLRLGVDKKVLGEVPKIDMPPVDNARSGFITEPQYKKIIANLPADLAAVIEFFWLTGWRRQEGFNLTWSEIDFANQVILLPASRSKNKDARPLPFSKYPALAALIYRQAESKISEYVFPRRERRGFGRPITDMRIRWRKAVAEAGIPGAVIHDFRRSLVKRLVAARVPDKVIMMITGHKTHSVFERYNVTTINDLEQATATLSALEGTDKVPTRSSLPPAAISA